MVPLTDVTETTALHLCALTDIQLDRRELNFFWSLDGWAKQGIPWNYPSQKHNSQ